MSSLNTRQLKQWFLATKRDLPWRETNDPYAIWISEVMLQQTQASVVIPYFLRWLKRFPTIASLAEADVSEVIKLWEGLGYYSRARNLHAGARYLMQHFNGKLPSTEQELLQIKGLGPYTVGAILSFAFHQKKAAVDGNVLRVLARCLERKEDISKSSTQKKFRGLLEELLPEEDPWIISEALIELGATICQRKPRCYECPLASTCLSYQNDCVEDYPVKTKGPPITPLYRSVAVIECEGYYLIQKGKTGKVMADLYEFPFFETNEQGISLEEIRQYIKNSYAMDVCFHQSLPTVAHGFTRYHVRLTPFLLQVKQRELINDYDWIALQDLQAHPFSSGHRRILKHLLSLVE